METIKIMDEQGKFNIKYLFWTIYILASILIVYNANNSFQELQMKLRYGYNAFSVDKPDQLSILFSYFKILYLPISLIFLGFKKKIGWSLMIIGIAYLIPHLIFEYINYLNRGSIVKIIEKLFPGGKSQFEYIITPILFTLIGVIFSLKRIREFLNIEKKQAIITYIISGLLLLSPWYSEILPDHPI